MDSISFGEYLYAGEFIQKIAPGPLSYTSNKPTNDNKWFNSQKLQKATQDGVQEPPHEGEAHLPKWWSDRPSWEAAQPTLEPIRSMMPHVCFQDLHR